MTVRWNSYQPVEKANFFVHYECDDETVKHVLKLDGYDGDERGVLGAARADTCRRRQRSRSGGGG